MGARVNDSLGSNLPPHLLPYHLFLFMRSPHTVIHLMDYNRRISHECLETVLFFLSPLLSKKSPGYSLLLFLNNAFETLVIAGFQPFLGIGHVLSGCVSNRHYPWTKMYDYHVWLQSFVKTVQRGCSRSQQGCLDRKIECLLRCLEGQYRASRQAQCTGRL